VQARIVEAGRGARWLAEGWRLFRAAPVGWLAAIFGYWLLMTGVSLLPLVGVAAAAVLVPAFSVGFMALARAAGHHSPLELGLLFDGFRHGLRAQIVLGVVYLVALGALLAASALADEGALAGWMLTGRRPPDEVLQSDAFVGALMAAAALYMPVMLAFWFAPPLAAWHSTGPAKALFFSFAAAMMNWRAFLAYGAVTAVVTLLVPFVLLSALALASAGNLSFPAATLVFPLLIVLLPTLFASFYASYRDVFGYDAAP
jgi:hypothetical protein